MSPDQMAREIHDVRKTLERIDASLADTLHLLGQLNERIRMLEKDAMRRGSQVVTMRLVPRFTAEVDITDDGA